MTEANFDSLEGISRGQYDIRLGRDDQLEHFFETLPRRKETSLGGYDLRVPIAPFDGPSPVAATDLRIRFMGPKSERRDWNIPSQRPDTAYPLWRLDRKSRDRTAEHYVVIARDVRGAYHARWLDPAALTALPAPLQQTLRSKNFGVRFMAANDLGDESSAIVDKLRSDHNVLLYGPPGTGKTRLMWDAAKAFGGDPLQIDTKDEAAPLKGGSSAPPPLVRWVTFHQSYGYEDFVVGLRPDPTSDKALSLKAFPGVLLELSEHVRTTGGSAVLLIDEINRGNVSRIFGEFITLLEPDKRLAPDGSETGSTVKLRLPYIDNETAVSLAAGEAKVPNPFTMPANLYLLASMNSVDRSVAPLDAALRRRFRIVNVDPDPDKLGTVLAPVAAASASGRAELERVHATALGLLVHLNRGISAFRGPDYRLGHWYFADLLEAKAPATARSALAAIWEEKLLPHLEDIFHGRAEQLAALIGNGGAVELVEPSSEFSDVGGRPFIQRCTLAEAKLLIFLEALAGTSGATTAPIAPGIGVAAPADPAVGGSH